MTLSTQSAPAPTEPDPSAPAPTEPDPPGRGSPYAELSHRIRQAGLLERRAGYYAWKMGITSALLVAGWTAFVLVGNSWWQLVVAVFLAGVFTQVGFLGHDAGHRQIFKSKRANYIVGILHGNLAIGLSYGWWVDKHHRHHANPNTEGADPDIDIGALAFTVAQTHARGRVGRWFGRWQAFLFFPLLLLEGANLHVASMRAMAGRAMRNRSWERVLFVTHLVGYFGVVFLVLSPVRAVVFIAVQQGLFGLYLGCSFAPNHKGMPIIGADEKIDFLSRQVLTSRNVRGGWFTDFLLGGLNYQIEHHLFPNMPRPNLRHAQAMIREFCLQHGLPYAQTGLFSSYAQALRHLHETGRPVPAVA